MAGAEIKLLVHCEVVIKHMDATTALARAGWKRLAGCDTRVREAMSDYLISKARL
jgi:hypothetical protein